VRSGRPQKVKERDFSLMTLGVGKVSPDGQGVFVGKHVHPDCKDSRAPSHPKAGHCPDVPMTCASYPVEVPIGQRTGLSKGLLDRG
jgi:hypothetical protein